MIWESLQGRRFCKLFTVVTPVSLFNWAVGAVHYRLHINEAEQFETSTLATCDFIARPSG